MTTSDQYRALPRDVATTPRDGDCLTDRWWVCTPDGLLFWSRTGRGPGWSPQCNGQQVIAESLSAEHRKLMAGVTVEHFPVVFAGRWDADYGHNPFAGLS